MNTPTLLRRAGPVLLLLWHSLPVRAQLQSPVFHFDLDVPAGNYSEWVLDSPQSTTGVSATIAFKELRPKDPWLPSFALSVGDSVNHVTLRFSPQARNGPLVARLEEWTADRRRSEQSFQGSYRRGQGVSFEIHWTPDGSLTAVFEDDTLRARFQPPVSGIGVSVSSGQVKASRLVYWTAP